MKTFYLFAACALTAISVCAQENCDTVTSVKNPTVVKVISSGNKKTIIVEGRQNEPEYYLEYNSSVDETPCDTIEEAWLFNIPLAKNTKKKRQRNLTYDAFCELYAGAVIPTAADRGFSRTGWEIGMLNLVKSSWQLSRCGTQFSIGIGWQYRHFTIGDGMMLGCNENNALELYPIPQGFDNVKSSLKSFAIQFPFALSQKIYRAFTIELGGIAMLNTYTTGNCSWSEGDVYSKHPIKNLHQRLLTLDTFARIGWRDNFAFYVRYAPMSQFKPHHGPQFDSVSIGLSIGF